MRLQDNGDSIALWVSANDTYDWAHKVNASWPCSALSGHRFFMAGDSNGLLEFTIDGKDGDVDAHEFNACVSDMLDGKIPEDHPCWFVFVGQFK